MLFAVSVEWLEGGSPMSKEELLDYLERSVIPSLEMLGAWELDGRILAGGFFPGERTGTWIMEAASTEEIGEWLSGLFFWGQVKCHVRALQSITSTIEREREVRKLLELRIRPGGGEF